MKKRNHDWANENNRPIKHRVRKGMIDGARYARRVIVLPSVECADVKVMKECGVVDENSEIIAVEQDKNIWPHIINNLDGMNYNLHRGKLHTLKVPGPVDHAMIDLCGLINPVEIDWIRDHLIPNLTEDSTFSCTFMGTNRAPGGNDNSFLSNVWQIANMANPDWQDNGIFCILPLNWVFHAQLLLLVAALNNKEYTCTFIEEYCDKTVPMLSVRFDHIRSKTFDLAFLLPQADSLKRSNAARMANATRRKNLR